MLIVDVHCSSSLLRFTSWFHVHIDPEVDLHGYHQRFLRRFHQKDHRKYRQKLLQRHQSGFTPQLHHHFHLWVINIILDGILKEIIVVSLRVIDGGFCPGDEFLTIRRGLRCIQDFLSDRLLELGVGYLASASGVGLQFLAAAQNQAQPSLLNPTIERNITAHECNGSPWADAITTLLVTRRIQACERRCRFVYTGHRCRSNVPIEKFGWRHSFGPGLLSPSG
jgi:hypothetical protein